MRKYKVGDVIKFKDLSLFPKEDYGIDTDVLLELSKTGNHRICEITDSTQSHRNAWFCIDTPGYNQWNFRIAYIDESSLITPEQKNHILQLIREI